jgi:hypothetical protein
VATLFSQFTFNINYAGEIILTSEWKEGLKKKVPRENSQNKWERIVVVVVVVVVVV